MKIVYQVEYHTSEDDNDKSHESFIPDPRLEKLSKLKDVNSETAQLFSQEDTHFLRSGVANTQSRDNKGLYQAGSFIQHALACAQARDKRKNKPNYDATNKKVEARLLEKINSFYRLNRITYLNRKLKDLEQFVENLDDNNPNIDELNEKIHEVYAALIPVAQYADKQLSSMLLKDYESYGVAAAYLQRVGEFIEYQLKNVPLHPGLEICDEATYLLSLKHRPETLLYVRDKVAPKVANKRKRQKNASLDEILTQMIGENLADIESANSEDLKKDITNLSNVIRALKTDKNKIEQERHKRLRIKTRIIDFKDKIFFRETEKQKLDRLSAALSKAQFELSRRKDAKEVLLETLISKLIKFDNDFGENDFKDLENIAQTLIRSTAGRKLVQSKLELVANIFADEVYHDENADRLRYCLNILAVEFDGIINIRKTAIANIHEKCKDSRDDLESGTHQRLVALLSDVLVSSSGVTSITIQETMVHGDVDFSDYISNLWLRIENYKQFKKYSVITLTDVNTFNDSEFSSSSLLCALNGLIDGGDFELVKGYLEIVSEKLVSNISNISSDVHTNQIKAWLTILSKINNESKSNELVLPVFQAIVDHLDNNIDDLDQRKLFLDKIHELAGHFNSDCYKREIALSNGLRKKLSLPKGRQPFNVYINKEIEWVNREIKIRDKESQFKADAEKILSDTAVSPLDFEKNAINMISLLEYSRGHVVTHFLSRLADKMSDHATCQNVSDEKLTEWLRLFARLNEEMKVKKNKDVSASIEISLKKIFEYLSVPLESKATVTKAAESLETLEELLAGKPKNMLSDTSRIVVQGPLTARRRSRPGMVRIAEPRSDSKSVMIFALEKELVPIQQRLNFIARLETCLESPDGRSTLKAKLGAIRVKKVTFLKQLRKIKGQLLSKQAEIEEKIKIEKYRSEFSIISHDLLQARLDVDGKDGVLHLANIINYLKSKGEVAEIGNFLRGVVAKLTQLNEYQEKYTDEHLRQLIFILSLDALVDLKSENGGPGYTDQVLAALITYLENAALPRNEQISFINRFQAICCDKEVDSVPERIDEYASSDLYRRYHAGKYLQDRVVYSERYANISSKRNKLNLAMYFELVKFDQKLDSLSFVQTDIDNLVAICKVQAGSLLHVRIRQIIESVTDQLATINKLLIQGKPVGPENYPESGLNLLIEILHLDLSGLANNKQIISEISKFASNVLAGYVRSKSTANDVRFVEYIAEKLQNKLGAFELEVNRAKTSRETSEVSLSDIASSRAYLLKYYETYLQKKYSSRYERDTYFGHGLEFKFNFLDVDDADLSELLSMVGLFYNSREAQKSTFELAVTNEITRVHDMVNRQLRSLHEQCFSSGAVISTIFNLKDLTKWLQLFAFDRALENEVIAGFRKSLLASINKVFQSVKPGNIKQVKEYYEALFGEGGAWPESERPNRQIQKTDEGYVIGLDGSDSRHHTKAVKSVPDDLHKVLLTYSSNLNKHNHLKSIARKHKSLAKSKVDETLYDRVRKRHPRSQKQVTKSSMKSLVEAVNLGLEEQYQSMKEQLEQRGEVGEGYIDLVADDLLSHQVEEIAMNATHSLSRLIQQSDERYKKAVADSKFKKSANFAKKGKKALVDKVATRRVPVDVHQLLERQLVLDGIVRKHKDKERVRSAAEANLYEFHKAARNSKAFTNEFVYKLNSEELELYYESLASEDSLLAGAVKQSYADMHKLDSDKIGAPKYLLVEMVLQKVLNDLNQLILDRKNNAETVVDLNQLNEQIAFVSSHLKDLHSLNVDESDMRLIFANTILPVLDTIEDHIDQFAAALNTDKSTSLNLLASSSRESGEKIIHRELINSLYKYIRIEFIQPALLDEQLKTPLHRMSLTDDVAVFNKLLSDLSRVGEGFDSKKEKEFTEFCYKLTCKPIDEIDVTGWSKDQIMEHDAMRRAQAEQSLNRTEKLKSLLRFYGELIDCYDPHKYGDCVESVLSEIDDVTFMLLDCSSPERKKLISDYRGACLALRANNKFIDSRDLLFSIKERDSDSISVTLIKQFIDTIPQAFIHYLHTRSVATRDAELRNAAVLLSKLKYQFDPYLALQIGKLLVTHSEFASMAEKAFLSENDFQDAVVPVTHTIEKVVKEAVESASSNSSSGWSGLFAFASPSKTKKAKAEVTHESVTVKEKCLFAGVAVTPLASLLMSTFKMAKESLGLPVSGDKHIDYFADFIYQYESKSMCLSEDEREDDVNADLDWGISAENLTEAPSIVSGESPRPSSVSIFSPRSGGGRSLASGNSYGERSSALSAALAATYYQGH